MEQKFLAVLGQFPLFGDFVSVARYGSGHINDTYKVVCNVAGREVDYLLQRVNSSIFRNPPAMMDNIQRVTAHQRAKLGDVPDASRRTLTIVPTRDGKPILHAADGNWWRVYLFIEGARTYDVMQTPEQAFLVGQAFAGFQNQLADLPAPRLHEILPGFHDTTKRYSALEAAIQADAFNRAADAGPEIAFFEHRAKSFSRLLNRARAGEIPERITHNDTKLNNVMLDDKTGKGICVIDLDTVMPGLALNDFGDMCRTGTANAAEDERDLSKVFCRMDMFESIARGYCSAARFLVPAEREELVFSARLITMTIGIRFLTDYLSGDVYFHVARPGHNLDRCRTQIKMTQSMEEQEAKMEGVIKSLA